MVYVEALTEAELRVVFYAANYRRTGRDLVSPTGDVGRMTQAISEAVNQIGLDLIGEVAALADCINATSNWTLLDQVFPDTKRWEDAGTATRIFRHTITQTPSFLTVHTLTQRWHAALSGGMTASRAVA
ncbi:hypothetical protein [Micromonospora sp. NPDC007230]|uniref:hypothetical protein n=1 Tax=Micromonospora sp. NPDC007230 TaxID=3364237 RepID=UPI00369369BB